MIRIRSIGARFITGLVVVLLGACGGLPEAADDPTGKGDGNGYASNIVFSCHEEGCDEACDAELKRARPGLFDLLLSSQDASCADILAGPGCDIFCVPAGACVRDDLTYCTIPLLEYGAYGHGRLPLYGERCRCSPLSPSDEGVVW